MQHSFKLIWYLTGNQCKDLRIKVICDKREVREVESCIINRVRFPTRYSAERHQKKRLKF